MAGTGGVGVIFGVRSVGDYKNLHILKQPTASPEAVPLIPLDLVERFPDGYTPALQLHMDEGQTVDQDSHVIAVVVVSPIRRTHLILIDDLQMVVVDVFLVNKGNIFGTAVIPPQVLDMVGLDAAGLFHDPIVGIGDDLFEKSLPFTIGKMIIVQKF